MENSIEEDIKIVEKLINTMKSDRTMFEDDKSKEIYTFFINSLEHILSDYKRVLKENKILKEEKSQAWEEWNNLEQGSYETEQRLKRENEQLKENKTGLEEEIQEQARNLIRYEEYITYIKRKIKNKKQNAITKCNELQTENKQLRTELNSLQKELKRKDKQIEQYQNMLVTNDLLHIKESQDKDKIIDLMAEHIAGIADCPFESRGTYLDCERMCDVRTDKECWKQYFINKAKEIK